MHIILINLTHTCFAPLNYIGLSPNLQLINTLILNLCLTVKIFQFKSSAYDIINLIDIFQFELCLLNIHFSETTYVDEIGVCSSHVSPHLILIVHLFCSYISTWLCSLSVAVTFANSLSVSMVTKLQLVFTVAKILGLGIIIISGMVVLIQGRSCCCSLHFTGT